MKIISIFLFLLSINTFALVTKNCPQTMDVLFASPSIEKWYAVDAYENFFNREGLVGGEMQLTYKANSKCYYQSTDNSSLLHNITLEGSLRPGAKKPATLIAYLDLPIKGKSSNYIGKAVVYVSIFALDKSKGILTEDFGKLYFADEQCSWGDCIPTHVYLGSFDEVVVD